MVFAGIVGQAWMTDLQLFETEIFRALFPWPNVVFALQFMEYWVTGCPVTSFEGSKYIGGRPERKPTKKFMNSTWQRQHFTIGVDGRIKTLRLGYRWPEWICWNVSSLVLEVTKPLTTITWLGYRLSRSVGVGGASYLYAYLLLLEYWPGLLCHLNRCRKENSKLELTNTPL